MTARARELGAPVDLPPGRRGWRGGLAGLAAIAAVPCVAAINLYETGGWGSGSRTSVDYKLDGPGWIRVVLIATAIAFAVSAVLIWMARRPAWLALGLVLAALAGTVAVWAVIERSQAGRVEISEMRAVKTGASQAEVRRRFGNPAGHATLSRGGTWKSCEIYLSKSKDRFGDHRYFALCFRDGRLIDRAQFG
jgi:hypothetical protein